MAALEASSDACLRAGNFAEFLKAAQQLALVSYPALAADEKVSCNPEAAAGFEAAKLDCALWHYMQWIYTLS